MHVHDLQKLGQAGTGSTEIGFVQVPGGQKKGVAGTGSTEIGLMEAPDRQK